MNFYTSTVQVSFYNIYTLVYMLVCICILLTQYDATFQLSVKQAGSNLSSQLASAGYLIPNPSLSFIAITILSMNFCLLEYPYTHSSLKQV